MNKNFCSIGGDALEKYLSFYGEDKRIPFYNIMVDLVDDVPLRAKGFWKITEKDCGGHFNTLQGVMHLEAAAQAVICIAKAFGYMDNDDLPALQGFSGDFNINLQIRPGDVLEIAISDLIFKGRKGSASVASQCGGKQVTTMVSMRFRAQRAGAIERLSRNIVASP